MTRPIKRGERDIDYAKRDAAAVGGDLCEGCKGGDHAGHVAALGNICVGCACGWKPPVRVCERPDLQALIAGGDTEPRTPVLRARRDTDSRDAITHEAVRNAVLACGRCDRAIEGFEAGIMPIGAPTPLYADPCGCEVCEVPVWCRNATRRTGRKANALKHGMTYSREWHSWTKMKGRCQNPNYHAFDRYGGRGIRVCERWLGRDGFSNFLSDMGPRPPGTSLDRIDVNGNYEPSNCRWGTRKQQGENTIKTRWLTMGGRTMCLADWSRETGLARKTIRDRLKAGMPVEKALAPVAYSRAGTVGPKKKGKAR